MKYNTGNKIRLTKGILAITDEDIQNRDGFFVRNVYNCEKVCGDCNSKHRYSFIGDGLTGEQGWCGVEESSELLYLPKPKQFKI
jgi:hypothetical protein